MVVDRNLPGVLKIDDKGMVSEVFKASKKFRTPLNAARSILVRADKSIVVGDSATRQIYQMGDAEPKPLLTNNPGIGIPYAMAENADGDLFIADLEPPGRIFKLKKGSTEPEVFATQPGVRGLAVDAKGNLIVLTGLGEALLKYSPDGKREVILKDRPFNFPNSIVIVGEDIYVADSYKKCIWKIGADGKPVVFADKGLDYPGGLAVMGETILVTDAKAKAIKQIDSAGSVTEFRAKE